MAHAAVNHLRMPRGRPIAAPIIGCAEKGAALDYFARTPRLRLGRIVATLGRAATRIRTLRALEPLYVLSMRDREICSFHRP